MKYRLTVSAAALFVAGTSAQAAVMFYDLDGGGQAQFDADLATYGYTMQSATAWGGLPDWSITGVDGPVNTTTNNAIFNPGDIPFDLEFDSNLNPYGTGGPNGRGPGGTGLVGVGPSGGFGNPSNALLANFFVDSFDIFDVGGNVVAMEINALTLLGSNVVDLTLYDDNGANIGAFGGSAPTSGHRYGVLVTGADTIGVLNVYDAGGGAEGVMAVTTYTVPAPGALALLGLAGLARRRRR
jgi:uncharacterized protein (TIGR03382 family)